MCHETSPDTLILVDAVSSLGGVKIEMDAWGMDFLLTIARKNVWPCPLDLLLLAASDRAMKKAESVTNRGWYFDLLLMEKHRVKDSTPMTPVMPLIYALDFQLDRIFAEGLENRFATTCCHGKTRAGLGAQHGMEPLPKQHIARRPW